MKKTILHQKVLTGIFLLSGLAAVFGPLNANGQTAFGQTANGQTANGQTANGQTANGQSANGQIAFGQQEPRQEPPMDPHSHQATRTDTALPPIPVSRGRSNPFAPIEKRTEAKPAWMIQAFNQQNRRNSAQDLAAFRLSGIVWSRQLSQALINDTLVGIGDRIGGWTVVSIEKDRVILKNGNRTEMMKIKPAHSVWQPNQK